MSCGSKIRDLRKNNNMTQENFADYLGVSRQAISKWESDESFPETEKLIKIANLFNVSIDYLLKDNESSEIIKELVAPNYDVLKFKRDHNLCAFMIAFGVFLILNGLSIMLLISSFLEEEKYFISTIPFFIFLAISVGIFIYFGMKLDALSKFDYSLIKSYKEENEKEKRWLTLTLTFSTVLVLINLLILITILSLLNNEDSWPICIFLTVLSISVFGYIYMGIRISKFKNEEAKNNEKKGEFIVSACAILAVIIYLGCGFIFELWHIAWVVFPILILFGVFLKTIIYGKNE